ncbi:NAD-dependent epimerase/dehydratase family protein [Leucobacter chromiiresistens]|uniref:NAD-dependent epimerase/dehydratase family protein n=1 Tax=Leucobacter chromiiresistens TaxID=1079994 RepID=UPI000734E3AB|nr:NAD-dependent epimerase/dehydratase family protein [Leucobacter chromiiresistens]
MHTLITGAGQIGTQLARDLIAAGHTVTVLRRSSAPVAGARTHAGDAGDRAALRAAARGAEAVFHCIHAAYSAPAWRRELPHREQAVMDVAAELGIPVIFPESVYAYGRSARALAEHASPAPVSPLGEVRAALLEARAAHPAHTASVIASDLIGPTAAAQTSVVLGMILTPVATRRTPWLLGDPDAPHAVTAIPDLTRAMIAAVPLATAADTRLNAPTPPARSQRDMARDAAAALGLPMPRARRIPHAAIALAGAASPMMREMAHQRYLWEAPSELVPGRLTTEPGLTATPWEQTVAEWAASVGGASAGGSARPTTPRRPGLRARRRRTAPA